ncbi:hypothetical protein [Microbacterium sp.]|uniref:hypothetical protein n=1 Tax=Microbacterium sp. TaxID=51671 RepID=UPI0039E25C12
MDEPETTTPRRARLAADLAVLAVVGVLLIAAIAAGVSTLYTSYYGPSAFVTRYLDLLSSGRAADALHVPGVAVDSATLSDAGIDGKPSEALLRSAALAPLTDIEVVSEQAAGEGFDVTVSYLASGHAGTTTFRIEQDGWAGITPNWRFAQSPLAVIDLTLRGADRFAVNGFEMQRGQISAAGAEAAPLDPLPMLVFTPGLYAVSVDTAISTASGIGVLADSPLASTPLDVQTSPTDEFIAIVQQRVEEFLAQCATQEVLQPTACPFGLEVRDRLASTPQWSITTPPTITVVPDGAQWRIPATGAVAHIEVKVRSLFDGTVDDLAEDVPFQVDGTIAILPDGTASIKVGSPVESAPAD